MLKLRWKGVGFLISGGKQVPNKKISLIPVLVCNRSKDFGSRSGSKWALVRDLGLEKEERIARSRDKQIRFLGLRVLLPLPP